MTINKIKPIRHKWDDIYIINNKVYVSVDDLKARTEKYIEAETYEEETIKHEFIMMLQNCYGDHVIEREYHEQIRVYDLARKGGGE